MLSWTGLIWGLKKVPQSVLDEGMRAEHLDSVAAAAKSEPTHVHSSLKKVMPTAAALAVGAVNAAHMTSAEDTESPATHQDISGLKVDRDSSSQNG